MKALDDFYLQQNEPAKSTLIALREMILSQDANITGEWKYRMPVFCYKGKMFCYLWINKSTGHAYLGIVEGKRIEHPRLIQEKRSRMKIMPLDNNKDLPAKTITSILQQALDLYRKGIIKIA